MAGYDASVQPAVSTPAARRDGVPAPTPEFAPADTRPPIDFAGLAAQLWRGRWIVLAAAVAGLFAGLLAAGARVPRYTAALTLTPAQQPSSRNAVPGGLGGIAGLAGLGGGPQSATPFDIYLASLASRAVAARLADDPDVLHQAFAAEWEPAARRWHSAPSRLHAARDWLQSLAGVPKPPYRAPDAARMQAYLAETIKVSRDPTSPIVTVTYTHSDARFAADLLGRVHRLTDEKVRRSDLARSRSYIAYLDDKLRTTSLAEQRVAIVAILSDQERQVMTASAGLSYAAEPVEPPQVPIESSGLRPWMVILLGPAVGLLAGCLLALVNWRSTRGATAPPRVNDPSLRP